MASCHDDDFENKATTMFLTRLHRLGAFTSAASSNLAPATYVEG
jgi:hypothetical protein